MKQPIVLGWHFTGDKLRDGQSIPRKGRWLKHDGKCIMCESGLHASRRLIDALCYAPGNNLHRVACRQIVAEGDDKLVCRERKIIASLDAEELLWRASRKFALDVIHLWNAPLVVRQYLETGDESLRAAARAAAWATARTAARAAAWATAGDAVWAAAQPTAWAAALDAAWAAQNQWLETEVLKLMEHT